MTKEEKNIIGEALLSAVIDWHVAARIENDEDELYALCAYNAINDLAKKLNAFTEGEKRHILEAGQIKGEEVFLKLEGC